MTILRSITFSLLTIASVAQASSSKVHEVKSEGDLTKSGYAIVKFYADWCPPCRAFKSDFEKLADDFSSKAKFYSINVETQAGLAKKYSVQSLPTVAILLDGKEVKKIDRELLRSELEGLKSPAAKTETVTRKPVKRKMVESSKKQDSQNKKQKKSCK